MINRTFITLLVLPLLPTNVIGEITGDISLKNIFYVNEVSSSYQYETVVEGKLSNAGDLYSVSYEYDFIFRSSDQDPGKELADFRQLYFTFDLGGSELSLGAKQVFWGVTESKNVVDVINQRDIVGGQSAEYKLGTPAVSVLSYYGDAEVEYWYMPKSRQQTNYSENSREGFGAPIGAVTFSNKSEKYGGDHAVRLFYSSGNFDFAISSFEGLARSPISTPNGGVIDQNYPYQSSTGLELQYTSDAALLKLEAIGGKQGLSEFEATTFGVETTAYGISDTNYDLGLILEAQLDNRPQALSEEMLAYLLRLVANNSSDTEIVLAYLDDLLGEQSLVSLSGSHRLRNGLLIELEARKVNAANSLLPLYALERDDSVALNFKYFF